MPANACTPSDPSCNASTDACLAAVEYPGAGTFSLRMSYIAPIKPGALATGIAASAIAGAVLPNEPVCNLNGQGTTNFLLQFTPDAGTVEVGSSKPVSAVAGPFSFESDSFTGLGTTFAVQPAVLGLSDGGGCAFATSSAAVNLPVYLDSTGSSAILLPIQALALTGTVSTDQSCIGTYDVAAQDSALSCRPDATHPAFVPGGELTGFILLEDADAVPISVLNETLCVLLSQDAATYGTGGTPNRCKRDASSNIIFQGDWCSTTDSAATVGCADAVYVDIPFAASGVTVQ